MLRHRLRGVAGNAHHADAQLLRMLHVNIIKAGTAHQHQFHVLLVQNVKYGSGHVGADEGTDGIKALCHRCGSGINVGFGKFYVNLRESF